MGAEKKASGEAGQNACIGNIRHQSYNLNRDQLHVAIAFGKNKYDKELTQQTLSLEEVAERLSNFRKGERDGGYFIPATFEVLDREGENIRTWSGAMLDLDAEAGATEEIIRKRLDALGLVYFAHTTHSHLEVDGVQRWRVFIPYNQPVPKLKHAKISRDFTTCSPALTTARRKKCSSTTCHAARRNGRSMPVRSIRWGRASY